MYLLVYKVIKDVSSLIFLLILMTVVIKIITQMCRSLDVLIVGVAGMDTYPETATHYFLISKK